MNPFEPPQSPVCPSDLYNVAPKPEPWSQEHQQANADSMLQAYRRTQRQRARTIALAISILVFGAICALWHFLSTHFLPPHL